MICVFISFSGLKYVITETFRNVKCSAERYQPIRFWSNKDTDCLLLKTKCNELGQIVYDSRSTDNNAACRCDYTRGYAFVSQPRNQCFCIPSEEECSCLIKQCPNNTTLSPGRYFLFADFFPSSKSDWNFCKLFCDDKETYFTYNRCNNI